MRLAAHVGLVGVSSLFTHGTMFRFCLLWSGILLLGLGVLAGPAHAQDEGAEDSSCTLLCQPELALEPAVDFEPLTEAARVVEFENGQPADTTRGGLETPFELTLAVDVPTRWPRLELGLDVAWTPLVDAEENPFTGREGAMTENPVEFSAEVSVTLLREEDTGGWVGIEASVADELGPAERPNADRWYTHKLALAIDVAVLPFHRFEHAGYLRGVEFEGSLDFAATGIPQEDDRFPDERFLDDESPWGASVALILPLAPLSP